MTTGRTNLIALGLGATAALTLVACGNSAPLDSTDQSSSTETIVVGSQDYYSNEIIAEIYAQGLENAGLKVDRQFRIGQREVYLPEIEAGKIDLFPEYTGNLLQYWSPDTTARLADDVYTELVEATPDGLKVLTQAPASDQDSYTVTQVFAQQWDLSTIDDLVKVTEPLTLGGNSELETRPYGPQGLQESYGVLVSFTPIEDAGGPLTIKALADGEIQLANVYTADPAIAANDLVVLTDTKGLFLASHIVALTSESLDDQAAGVIDGINAVLTPDDLVALNARSVEEELPAAIIATDWLKEKNL